MVRQHIPFEDLSAHADGALPAWRAAQVCAHLGQCAACRAAFGELQWTIAFSRAMPWQPPPESAVFRLPAPDRAAALRLPLPRAAALALAACAVLGSLGLLWSSGRQSTDRLTMQPDYDRQSPRTTAGPRLAGQADQEGPAAAAHVGAEGETSWAMGEQLTLEIELPSPPDSKSAGYPEPFATARQDDMDRVGGVPPPELAAGQHSESARPIPGYGETARAATATGPPMSAATGQATPAAGRGSVVGPSPEPSATLEAAAPETGVEWSPDAPAGRPLAPVVVAAAVMLLASALLFVRASRR